MRDQFVKNMTLTKATYYDNGDFQIILIIKRNIVNFNIQRGITILWRKLMEN